MTSDRTLEGKGLAGDDRHVVHGSDDRRSPDLDARRVSDGRDVVTGRALLFNRHIETKDKQNVNPSVQSVVSPV